MKIELPSLTEYKTLQRPINFRPLVAFTVFFIFGIIVSSKLTPVFCIIYVLFLSFLCIIAHANDYKKLLICLLGFIFGLVRLLVSRATNNALNSLLVYFAELFMPIRDALCEQTFLIFGDASDVINAILWGDTSNITQIQRSVFSAAGISHILAISGLHVSFFISVFNKIIPKHLRKFKFIFCSLFLFVYCCITAFSPSLMRASIMTALYLFSSAFFVHYDSPSSVSLSALIILFVKPHEIFSLSFQLSFAAIIGILLVYKPIKDFFQRYFPDYFASAISVTSSATLGTLPFSVYTFKTFSTYTLIGNIFLIPFAIFLVITSFFAVILSFVFPPVADLLVHLSTFAYDCMYTFSLFLYSLPYSVLKMDMPFVMSLCIYAAMFVSSKYYLRSSVIKLPILAAISLLALFSVLVI